MAAKRALITGVTGQDGSYLAEFLLEKDYEVAGFLRSSSTGHLGNVEHLRSQLHFYRGSLDDDISIERAVTDFQPDEIYNLGAEAAPADSFKRRVYTSNINALGPLRLFESALRLRNSGKDVRVYQASSSGMYGTPKVTPQDETTPFRPNSPYAVSKIAQDMLGLQYFNVYRLPIVRVRPFNHTGPGHDARFVIPSIARQLAQIEMGEREPVLRVGNLDVERDFTDARDMVRAYRLAALRGAPGEVYNLGRGEAIRIGHIVETLVADCRVPVRVLVDPALLRSVDLLRQQADISKFTQLCGWQPSIAWQTTLHDTLQYWRQRVGSSNEEIVCVS